MSNAPQGHIKPGLVTQPLTQEQWATLDKVNEALTKDYAVRRQMLLTRCDVTLQSFRWCDKAKASNNAIIEHMYMLNTLTPLLDLNEHKTEWYFSVRNFVDCKPHLHCIV